jgi:NAD(P)-dependent dehydrogenase (short-subunit alcohol dehydrogenase family)
MTLDGRRALVSGGGRGIGRAIARALADAGADVAISYRRDEGAAAATVAEIQAAGRKAAAFQASIDDWDDDAALAAAVLDSFGAPDILVHNAGIASRGQTVADTDPDEVVRLWRTHTFGPFALSKLFLPAMREAARGDIVFVSSAATVHHSANAAPYNMAKASMEALAHTLAKEERRNGIRVNIVAPGLVETEMGRRLVKGAMGVDDIRALDASSPFGHVCTPEEVADVVRFLVTTGYANDQKVVVDGGSF